MAEPLETIVVDSTQVSCGGGALGHPRIYMTIPAKDGHIECPYCSSRFELKPDALAQAGGH